MTWEAEQIAFVFRAFQMSPKRTWGVKAEVTMLTKVSVPNPFGGTMFTPPFYRKISFCGGQRLIEDPKV